MKLCNIHMTYILFSRNWEGNIIMNEVLRQEKLTIWRPEMSNLSCSLSYSSLIAGFPPSSSQTKAQRWNYASESKPTNITTTITIITIITNINTTTTTIITSGTIIIITWSAEVTTVRSLSRKPPLLPGSSTGLYLNSWRNENIFDVKYSFFVLFLLGHFHIWPLDKTERSSKYRFLQVSQKILIWHWMYVCKNSLKLTKWWVRSLWRNFWRRQHW